MMCSKTLTNKRPCGTQCPNAETSISNHVKPDYPSNSSGNPSSVPGYTLEQWDVSCGTIPESTDPNQTGCNEADKIPRVTSSNLTSSPV
ncbi:hypothetical protein PR048_003872 [Dryococelus australis]|uniref:Uncharacterized protein n=1 Tax=Dryococelus australis TaxID=614101 RepID=A0ABQ9IPA8_9NEOP|nr:hypothetical protein PR048_003872 [Dryococelus australis]